MNNRGFTLIELFLAALILSLIGTLTWGSLSATFQTQAAIEKKTQLQDIGTATMLRIREDLTQVIHVQALKPITTFKGEDDFDRDKISFTSLSHRPTGLDVRESDQTEITYETEADPDQPNLYRLRRRESPFIDDEPDEGGDFATLATNVAKFDLEYGDIEDFEPEWDVRSSEHLNKLPKLVHVTLILKDEKDREETFETYVELPMAEGIGLVTQGTPGQPGAPGVPPAGQPGSNLGGGGQGQ